MIEIPLLKVFVKLANGRLIDYDVSGVECLRLPNGQPYDLKLTDWDNRRLAKYKCGKEWVRVIFDAPPLEPS